MYVDAHCHLDDERLADIEAEVFARAADAGVSGFVVAGVDPASWARQRALAARRPGVRWTAGLHPCAVASLSAEAIDAAMSALPAAFEGPNAATGLGETGLDTRFCARESLSRQESVLRASLALARALNVPVVLHLNGQGTHARALATLRADGLPRAGGMVHAYSGSAELVAEYVALGLHISFAGTVCRPEARKVHAAARAVPADRLLLETDAPDLTPPDLPRPNEPAALLAVAASVAALRGDSAAALLARSAAACAELFGEFTLRAETRPPAGVSLSCPS
jgi:TatD DNase family protein